jgi:23S rRNA (pseudouridine1915-N3)-methyltransferase
LYRRGHGLSFFVVWKRGEKGGIRVHIQIVAVGKLKEKYLVDGIAEYMKRLGPYAKVQINEVADEKAPDTMSPAEEQQVKEREGERILALVKKDAHVIAMAIDGKTWSSEELSQQIANLGTYGQSHIVFIIGGSNGLSEAVLKRADQRLSFGRITYPHQLMRLILVEQVYRAFKIMRGESYHK